MGEFSYAKGRISESLQFIAKEMTEFDKEYAKASWKEYQLDPKLQKLIDRTVENILTALIEICGTILTNREIVVENYSSALSKAAEVFGFSNEQQENIGKLAIQRNRLAHRYLDFKWQAIKFYQEQSSLLKELLNKILDQESAS